MASTSKQSGLQRSRSSSCIPLSHRLSSRLPTSTKGSMQKGRSKSIVRQDQAKLSLDRNVTRFSSNLNIDVSRLSRQRSGSLVRLTTSTPLSIRSGRKSPLLSSAKKDNRPISDKRWQYEQVVKVRNFVNREFKHLDYNNVKSGMPLELFVALMDSYFKLIDKRVRITRENYVEEVPSNLKRYRYPASIKPSLMKTVNTPHSWPHVVAILAWLTDIINEINSPPIEIDNDLENLVDNCCLELYLQWNRCQDESMDIDDPLQELDLKLVEMYNLDDNAFKQMETEISTLHTEISAYNEKKKTAMKKLEELETNIHSTNNKCDTYLTESCQHESNLKDQYAKYAENIKNIDEKLAQFSRNEQEIKSVIASQPHSHIEYEQLSQEIKDLQNTIKLKEERCNQQRELIDKYDFKLSDIKQKVEASAYKYNNIISQLELYNPQLSKLHVRESGFARKDTEDEIYKIQKMLTETVKTLKLEHEHLLKEKVELRKRQEEMDVQIAMHKKELDELKRFEAEMEITVQCKIKGIEKEKEQKLQENNKYRQRLEALRNSRFDLKPLEDEMKKSLERKIVLLKSREDLKETALNFFVQLSSQMSQNIDYYTNTIEEIAAAMVSTQEKAMSDAIERMEILKKEREEAESL